MSHGMRSSDLFNQYDDRFSSASRQTGRSRYGADSSFSQFHDREERLRDTFSRPNRSNFGNRRGGGGGFRGRKSSGKGMRNYGMDYDDMRGRAEYNERVPRSPLMRGTKRNMSPDSRFGDRFQGAMGMSDNLSTTEALLSLGLQTKHLLELQPTGYGPPAPKMRRLNEGFGRSMPRGRGTMRRSGAARARRGSTRVQKPFKTSAWKKAPYHCTFCRKATNDREFHWQHLRTKEHRNAVRKREEDIVARMHSIYKRSRVNLRKDHEEGLLVRFCGGCYLEYAGKVEKHKQSYEHREMMSLHNNNCNDCDMTLPNRILFERHTATVLHVGNHVYNLMEAGKLADDFLECPEEYDENTAVGVEYTSRRTVVYCKVCDKHFSDKDITLFDHCKSKEHFDNFKVFVVDRKIELEEKAKEAAAAKEANDENEENGAEEDEVEAEDEKVDGDGEAENEDEAIDGEAENDEAIDGEAENEGESIDGEAENDEAIDGEAENDEAIDGEAENEDESIDGVAEEEEGDDGEAEDEAINAEAEEAVVQADDAVEVDDKQAPAEKNEDVEMEEAEEEAP